MRPVVHHDREPGRHALARGDLAARRREHQPGERGVDVGDETELREVRCPGDRERPAVHRAAHGVGERAVRGVRHRHGHGVHDADVRILDGDHGERVDRRLIRRGLARRGAENVDAAGDDGAAGHDVDRHLFFRIERNFMTDCDDRIQN